MLDVAYRGEWNKYTPCTTLPFTGSMIELHEASWDFVDVVSFDFVSCFPMTLHKLETSKLACITPEPLPYDPNAVCRGNVCSPDCCLSTSFMDASMAACAASSSSSSSSAKAASAGTRNADAAPARDAETTARRVGGEASAEASASIGTGTRVSDASDVEARQAVGARAPDRTPRGAGARVRLPRASARAAPAAAAMEPTADIPGEVLSCGRGERVEECDRGWGETPRRRRFYPTS